MTRNALDGILVVDVGGSVATAYCGKLFADFGARVINVEPPESGHPIRRLAPFKEGAPASEASGLAAYLSTKKQSVVLPLAAGIGAKAGEPARRLCEQARVVLQSGPPQSLPFAPADLPATTILVSITWFGLSGPYRDRLASDATLHAIAGLVRNFGPVEGPPLLPTGHQPQILGGLTALVATLGHLIGDAAAARGAAGDGATHLDLSLLEATMCMSEPGPVGFFNRGELAPRLGINRFAPTYPAGIYRCREGWLGVTAVTPAQWRILCELVGLEELGREPRYQAIAERLADADLLDAEISPRLLTRTAEEWFHAGQDVRLPLAIVQTPEELLEAEQFAGRGTWTRVEHPDLGTFTVPSPPFRLLGTPAVTGGRAPRLGEHTEAVLAELTGASHSDPTATTTQGRGPGGQPARHGDATRRGPLSGLRIVDLSMGWAGPLAARHLADLGAEVVKVESCQVFDWWRGWEVTEEMLSQRLYEHASAFNMVNRNKLGITLDLTRPEGSALLRRLVAKSHGLIENYAGSVLPKLGLGYDQLVAVNPDLVMLSMPPFGATGPWQDYRAYGSTVEHASGLPHFQGEPDGPPTMQHVALGDPVAGLNGAAAMLVALTHLERTGQGQRIDLSHVESLFPFAAPGLVAQTMNGTPPQRWGRRHATDAPHGVYRCRGEERWVVLTVASDEQWRGLCRTAGNGGLAADARFSSAAGRKRHEDELDRILVAWTAEQDRDDVVSRLLEVGVPAAPVLDSCEVLADAHLEARGFWQWLERAHVGLQPNPSPPYRCGDAPPDIAWPAPTLGEHNRRVLQGILDVPDDELERLEREGIIGTEPVPRQT